MKKNLSKVFVGLFGIAISVAALIIVFKKINLNEVSGIIKEIEWWHLLVLTAIYFTGFIFRSLRWKLMLTNLGHFKFSLLLKTIIVGFAGNNLIPARGGELLRMEYFYRKANVARVSALTSVLVEKILDGISLLFILIATMWFMPAAQKEVAWFTGLYYTALFVFISALLGIFLLRIFEKPILKLLNKRAGVLAKIQKLVLNVSEALRFFSLNLNFLTILFIGLLVWLVEGAMFGAAYYFLNIDASYLVAGYLTLVIVNFGLLVPSSPGYVGVFQAMTILALGLFGLSKETALGASVIIHFCQFAPITIVGIFILGKDGLKLFSKNNSNSQKD